MFSHVLGGGDEPAENDGVESVLDELFDDCDRFLEFGVLCAAEFFSVAGHPEELPVVLVGIFGDLLEVAARADVGPFGEIVGVLIEHGAPAYLVCFGGALCVKCGGPGTKCRRRCGRA